jgi:hypothetical protein
MSLGTVFISHKHKDKEIAKVIGDFMKDASGNRIDIYLSSDPRYKGTRAGESLPQELDKAITKSGVVILVYTGKSAKSGLGVLYLRVCHCPRTRHSGHHITMRR